VNRRILTISCDVTTLVRGEQVKLNRIGTLMVRSKRERIGRNSKTGIEATITPRWVVTYKPPPALLGQMNDGAGDGLKDVERDNAE